MFVLVSLAHLSAVEALIVEEYLCRLSCRWLGSALVSNADGLSLLWLRWNESSLSIFGICSFVSIFSSIRFLLDCFSILDKCILCYKEKQIHGNVAMKRESLA